MKITHVTYRRLKSHDRGYGHDCVEAQAAIDGDETPEEVLDGLRFWVLDKLNEIRETDVSLRKLTAVNDDVERADRELNRIRAEIQTAQDVVRTSERLLQLARAAGLEDEAKALADFDAEIPF